MSDTNDFKSKYGPWALVTGASSGIGQEFARQLASLGINVAVVARRQNRLESLVSDLESEHGVQARAIPVDLTAPDYLEVIKAAVSDIEIGLLVNNAGGGHPGSFLKQSLADRTRVVQLNVTAPMQLAHVFGEKMSRSGRGGIIFVSSLAAYTGSPFLANYAATKSYQLNLGTALHQELKPKGIDVLVLSPGPTRTEMVDTMGGDMSSIPMSWMDAGPVAAVGLKALGHESAVIPGRLNRLMTFTMTHLLPRNMALSMFGNMMAKTMDPAIL
jgi:short-subunit dehydrogenase